MPFKIDAFKASAAVQAMHPTARAGYIYLMLEQWQTDDCTLPMDHVELAEMSGLGDELWAQHGPRILRKFDGIEPGRIRNSVVFDEWIDAKKVFDRRSANALRTNSVRSAHDERPMSDQSANDERHTGTGTETETGTEVPEVQPAKDKPSQFSIPPWVSEQTWKCFEEMRRRIRKPLTDRARENILAKLDEFRGRGHDPEEVLNNSISNGWTGIWEPLKGGERGFSGQGGSSNRGQARSDANNEAARRAIDSILRGSTPGVSGSEAGDSGGHNVQAIRAASSGV